MSNWTPTPGKGNELRRMLCCYGKPPAVASINRMPDLLGFDFLAMGAANTRGGMIICKAKASTVDEAKVCADALAKYARHMAQRKDTKDARRERKHGGVERELIGLDGIDREGGEE